MTIIVPHQFGEPLPIISLDLKGVVSPDEHFIQVKRNGADVRVWSHVDEESTLPQKLEDLVVSLVEEKKAKLP